MNDESVIGMVPLQTASFSINVMTVLLSRGADVNHDGVMWHACMSPPECLQFIIDAGGDINAESNGRTAVENVLRFMMNDGTPQLLVLLSQPSLIILPEHEEFARWLFDCEKMADMIADEARRRLALTPDELCREHVSAATDSLRRLHDRGLPDLVVPALATLLGSLRFVWIRVCVCGGKVALHGGPLGTSCCPVPCT